MTVDTIYKEADVKMAKGLAQMQAEFSKLRTGRAHPSLLEHIQVSCYGDVRALNQVASVNVEDARTLVVTPWDKSVIQAVEKAIINSELGLNPNTAGTVIRVPLPLLTEERRKEFVKLVKAEAENARIVVRNVRRDANGHFKELLKKKEISEDEEHRAQSIMQKLTDGYIANIDRLLEEKEIGLMEV